MPRKPTAKELAAAEKAGQHYQCERWSAWMDARGKGGSGSLALERVRRPRFTRPALIEAFEKGRKKQQAALRD